MERLEHLFDKQQRQRLSMPELKELTLLAIEELELAFFDGGQTADPEAREAHARWKDILSDLTALERHCESLGVEW